MRTKMIGVKDILIPAKNESDYLELDEEITSGVNIHLVEDMRQVLDLALVR
ncbi:MAG: S16 family serine protease [Coprococcus sp.]